MDWTLYKQILFNLVQNAVKYNSKHGDLVILLRCLPMQPEVVKQEIDPSKIKFDILSMKSSMHQRRFSRRSPQLPSNNRASGTRLSQEEYDLPVDAFMFETVIIDSGVGIDKAR
mmetsp:Transcript_10538/g.16121  ORF Transcript_10538/g.16121 Transcript_10538/m.16121 type:complete len:114 (+) Transcript_10538:795-1136(+)